MNKDVLKSQVEDTVPFRPSRELDDSWIDPVRSRIELVGLVGKVIGAKAALRRTITAPFRAVGNYLRNFDDTPRTY